MKPIHKWILLAIVVGFLIWRTVEMPDLERLTPAAKKMLQGLRDYAASKGYVIVVTSGYRDPAYQKQLQERWDAGDRTGLRVRPASSSTHTRGNAVDISAPDYVLRDLGAWAQGNGYRWGGTFSQYDPVHFDIEAKPV